jgi:oligopeptide transport system ATP-binding protein
MDELPLLDVIDLRTHFFTRDGVVRAVNGVNFQMRQGETLGIVGESGSGKSMTALSIMRLVPDPPGKIIGGQILFQGVDLLQLREAQMCRIRGREIALVFQDPMTAFDPLYRVGAQIEEAIEWHLHLDRKARRARTIDALERVGIPAPAERSRSYPHEFSGGMIQRAMIAMALACEPKLLIADEPTTALDVTMESQIVDLLRDLQRTTSMGMIYVTHNMGVVARIAQRVAVMYAGTLVETAPTKALFRAPKHPYTLGLMRSVPRVDGDMSERLPAIEGLPPDLIDMPDACPFAPRCPYAIDRCWDERPQLRDVGEEHRIACFVDL